MIFFYMLIDINELALFIVDLTVGDNFFFNEATTETANSTIAYVFHGSCILVVY